MPIIIIPAICKDKGSPFGDPDVFYQYGMAYASYSMAVCNFVSSFHINSEMLSFCFMDLYLSFGETIDWCCFIWTYVYNIMRISSRNVQKEGNRSGESITLEDSGDVSESLIEEGSENISPTKCNVDDAYTLLLSKNQSEHKKKVATKYNLDLPLS